MCQAGSTSAVKKTADAGPARRATSGRKAYRAVSPCELESRAHKHEYEELQERKDVGGMRQRDRSDDCSTGDIE
jgi:hypothetical protein